MDFLKRYEDPIYAVTRVVVGFLFFCHGASKLSTLLSGGALQGPAAILWPAAIIEAVGGAMVAFGLFTVWAAFIASGQMAVAYFLAHQKDGLLPIQNKGELAALYSWIFLVIAARGAGIWSVDAVRGGR
jgi:putative oxidoreductase